MDKRACVRWAIWAVSLAALCVLALARMDTSGPVGTNVFHLLPGQHTDPVLTRAIDRSHEAFSQRMLILVSGPNEAQTRQAAKAAYQIFQKAGFATGQARTDLSHLLDLYTQHPYIFLTADEQQKWSHQGATALAEDAVQTLARPAGLLGFDHDPGGYISRFMSRLPRPYPDFSPDGPFMVAHKHNRTLFFLRLSTDRDAFNAESSKRVTALVHAATDQVQRICDQCHLQATGAALFADAARQEAEQETQWLTITSTIVIFLLIAFVFRSLAPHLLGFLQLFSSVVAAGAAVIAVFGSINILTLVFGTTLLGIAIDYVFLYFSEHWFGQSPPNRVLHKIRGGLCVSLASAILAFAFLLPTGFPALTQIAVFSIAGLLEAGLVVALIFPVTLRRRPQATTRALVRLPLWLIERTGRASKWRYLVPCLVLLAAVPGLFQLQFSDNIRSLSYFPPQLLHTDTKIRQTLGRFPASGFFLIQAPDMAGAIAREQALFKRLHSADADLTPMGLSRFLPGRSRQQGSLAAWQQVMKKPAALRHAFTQMGLPPALADHIRQRWQQAPHKPLTAKQLLQTAPLLDPFVVRAKGNVALLANVFGSRSIDNAVLINAAHDLEGVRYINPVQRITDIFSSVRIHAGWLVALGYLLIFVLLIWRYGQRLAWRMLYPSILALGITLGTLGWLGEPISVFVIVALILILGLGRDYVIFLHEVGFREQAPALAVTLSAITTLFAFGLLALSRIPVLHAFGLTTGIGILASYLLTPLSLPPTSGRPRK